MPNRKRPFETWSSEATSFAVWIVSRWDHQADGGAELEARRDRRRGAQRDERVHHVEIFLGQRRLTHWVRETASDRYVRMLGYPQRVEAALFERDRERRRGNRIVGEEN